MARTEGATKNILWWLCLFVAPAVLIGLELFHPAGFTQRTVRSPLPC